MDEANTSTNNSPNIGQKQLAGAIIIAGVLVAGAILLKGSSLPINTKTEKESIAKIVGLNEKSFQICLESKKFEDKVQADASDGLAAGVKGTPYFFILKNGKVVERVQGYVSFDEVIVKINEAKNNTKIPITANIRPIATDEHLFGNPDAEIVIVEYSDLECPYCKMFHEVMHQVVAEEGGEVAWIYRHFPMPSLHPMAFLEAEATECAWEQGSNEAFWKYTDKLFEITPSNNGLQRSQL